MGEGPAKRSRLARLLIHPATALATLAVSLAITALAWWMADMQLRQRAVERFGFQSEEVMAAIARRMLEYETVLRGGAAFLAGPHTGRAEWAGFVAALRLEVSFPGIQGLGYSAMIAPAELTRHVARMRAEGDAGYTVWPPGERGMYSAIVWLEPLDWRNRRALGYDMLSEPVRRTAMERARDTGEAAATGRVVLVQETGKNVQQGFLMYVPVYRRGAPQDSVEQRRAALRGFVYSPFRVDDLMHGILGPDRRHLDLEVFDGGAVAAENLLYHSEDLGRTAGVAAATEFDRVRRVDFAGREWTLRVHGTADYVSAAEKRAPLVVAGSGVAIDLLLFAAIRLLAQRWKSAEAAARRARAELSTNEYLFRHSFEHAPLGMAIVGMDRCFLRANPALCALLGYAERDMRGMSMDDLIDAGHVPMEAGLMQSLAAGEMEAYTLETRLRHASGQWIAVQKIVSLVRDASGAPYCTIGQVQDLSEREAKEYAALAARAMDIVEEERTRLSRDLHDEIGQALLALRLPLQRAYGLCPPGKVAAQIGQALTLSTGVVATVRRLAHCLRPSQLDDLGLVAALRWHVDRVTCAADIAAHFVENIGDRRLPADIESCCFRVAQESLTNVLRHARATTVTVTLTLDGDIIALSMRDDGVGFDAAGHDRGGAFRPLGLLGMRERVAALGGQFEIRSQAGKGTEVRATFADVQLTK